MKVGVFHFVVAMIICLCTVFFNKPEKIEGCGLWLLMNELSANQVNKISISHV
jgi:hypothetical protein